MLFTAELGGIYPRSEQLIELTRSYDREKTDRDSVEKQIEQDTIDLLGIEESSGFENFSDGALSWQDQLRPIVETLDGITTGTRYSRWFDTNTFYKKPTIRAKVGVTRFDLKKFVRSDLLPKSRACKVSLVGPYTFSELSENLHYKSKADLLSDIARVENEVIRKLRAAGVSQFQLSEPCLVYRPYTEEPLSVVERESALAALRATVDGVDAEFCLQTYFGDATSVLPDLLDLPVAAVGFDLFETDYTLSKIDTKKKIALGIVDARESRIEEPAWIAETATRVTKHIVSNHIRLVPNSDLKFVPRKVADTKTRSLAQAAKLASERS